MSIREVALKCTRDGLQIRGMQYFPEDFEVGKRYPAVVISHVFKGNHAHMADFGRAFAGLGYIAVCFSFCGGGRLSDDSSLQSDGSSLDMTISTEVSDLCAVIDAVTAQDYVDAENIFLLGASQGGFVSGLAAAKCGNRIKKLMMIFPAICIPDHARMGCLGGSVYDPLNVPEEIRCPGTTLGRAFHEDVVGMDPYLELSRYQGPVLILHGLNDTVVNYAYAVRAKEAYGKEQCHLQLIRGMGHGYDKNQFDSLMASIRQFLADRKEILTIRVIITRQESFVDGERKRNEIYFTGYCENEDFQGAVLPGGCDVQTYHPDSGWTIRAEYTLEGLDSEGQNCRLHIVNQWGGEDWKPVIDTDSAALAWLNNADLTAVLEGGAGGPTVRIYMQ